ncbi:hypothetical protein CVD25_16080 [Bacillus canaveralius]|uniref:ArsR family transcriptional regulator n=1 Tax=Bacillus canaveralius TaxID=1403243 RepID=A0ABX4T0Q8_9BACI|nr:hypothetical protein [Bacillus canaveralius]PLR94723.1 hypothetical protein CVD25_16080 [Bacillus canaveralius]RSK50480.1 hypothetical protein EJA13_14875 [Bacillus canaveralius]
MRELVKSGLLVLTDTRDNGGILEKYYLPVAKDFRIRLHDIEEADEGDNHKLNIVRKTINDFRDQYLRSLGKLADEDVDQQLFFAGQLTLNDQEAAMLKRELMAVIKPWQEKKNEDTTNANIKRYGAVLSLYKKED